LPSRSIELNNIWGFAFIGRALIFYPGPAVHGILLKAGFGVANNKIKNIGTIKMKTKPSAGYQPGEIHTLIHRSGLMRWLYLAAICISLAVGACEFRKVDASEKTNNKKEGSMEFTQTDTTAQNNIPPIDAAVSPETETATFALG
jgi:hypothetical protein